MAAPRTSPARQINFGLARRKQTCRLPLNCKFTAEREKLHHSATDVKLLHLLQHVCTERSAAAQHFISVHLL